jgi:ribosomal protein S18 acetylase RimI-like enzyme
MALTIRIFQPADTDPVITLWQRCDLTVPWNDPHQDIKRKLAVQPEFFLVGVKEGSLVASVMGGYDGHRGWIYYLAVDPVFRLRGYGRLILHELEKRLSEAGCPKINLMVRATNDGVLSFYRSLGYTEDEVVNLGKRLVKD